MWWSWWRRRRRRRRRRRTQVDRQGRLCRGLLGRWATKSLPPTWENISSMSTVVQRQRSPDFVNSLNLGWDLFVWQRRWVGGERRGGRGGGALAFKSWGAACSETVCDYHHHRGSSLFIASVIIITIAITLEDLREKDGACGGSTSATILHGACPVGSFQFDHDVEIYENLHSCCFDVPFPDYDVKIYKNLHLCCIDIPFPNRKKLSYGWL